MPYQFKAGKRSLPSFPCLKINMDLKDLKKIPYVANPYKDKVEGLKARLISP